ncbi:MAG: DegT/DnrJ/EryC1/StrS family aminotransferase [Rhodospirillales bacterium]
MKDGGLPAPIPYVDLSRHWAEERDSLLPAIEAVLASGQWVGGAAVEAFEQAFQAWSGIPHCVGVASGTDALILALRALNIGPGDEVITQPNSFVASAGAIRMVGAKPVFADVLPDQNMDPVRIEAAIGPSTKAIMVVHLTGRMGPMAAYRKIATDHGLALIEDAAQSVGSRVEGRASGAWGDVGCFSAHPLKNLNACGDAGFATAQDEVLAQKLRLLRNNGAPDRDSVAIWGTVSRLDPIQAVVLSERLKCLDQVIDKRRRNAKLYLEALRRGPVWHPNAAAGEEKRRFDTYHTFVIQAEDRDGLKEHLAGKGIGSAIHYPIPIHLQPAAAELGYGPDQGRGSFPHAERQAGRILSLPINQFMTEAQVLRVAETINGYYR